VLWVRVGADVLVLGVERVRVKETEAGQGVGGAEYEGRGWWVVQAGPLENGGLQDTVLGWFACWSLEAWRVAEGVDAEGEQWGDAHMELRCKQRG
jgi:hypothetical protein